MDLVPSRRVVQGRADIYDRAPARRLLSGTAFLEILERFMAHRESADRVYVNNCRNQS